MSMQSNVGIAGSAAVAGQRGMERAAAVIENAAGEVLQGTLDAISRDGGGSASDTVTLSDEARSASIADGLLDGGSARISYAANIRVVKASDDRFHEMINIGLEYVR
jgi:hypothetical protein